MPSDFKIFMFSNEEYIHLKLMGDFDGSSAWHLVQSVKDKCLDDRKVLIHTSGLSSLHAFGQKVLRENAQQLGSVRKNLIFTGKHADELSIPESRVYSG